MDNDPTMNARRLVLAALVLVGCAAMPITPPDPGKILAELRAVHDQLCALAANDSSALVTEAIDGVQKAIDALVALQGPA
jgi:hypothetical protein